MKPDIVKETKGYSKSIDGYIGVYCKCGKTLYVKNYPSKARQGINIKCPCGIAIFTIYTRYSHN